MPSSLTGLSFAVVGPGRVGTSLIGWLEGAGAELTVVGRRPDHPREGTGIDELTTAGSDLLILSVPDPALPEVASELAKRPQAAVALHTSGKRPAAVLEPLRAAGSAVGCFHPLRAFPRPLPDPAVAASTFIALGGDPAALAAGRRIASAFGSPHGEVPDEVRSLYHLGATLAAGGAATVLAAAAAIARAADLPPSVLAGYRDLALGAIGALPKGLPATAITGPAARAEASYADQLRELEGLDPALLPMARELALATLDLLDRELGPSDEREALRESLRGL